MSSRRSRSGGTMRWMTLRRIEQVFAELALRDEVAQVAVGGGDDAHVGGHDHLLGADLLDFAGFEEPQQQAPACAGVISPISSRKIVPLSRHLEFAGLVAIGAGEAALHVPEQLGLEQRFRNAGAVHRDERRRGAQRARPDRPGDDFLAAPALTGDEHLRVGARHPNEFCPQVANDCACANQLNVGGLPHSSPRLT